MGYLRVGIWGLGDIWGPVWEVSLEGHMRSILGSNEVNSGPYLGNLIILLRISFIWPWVGLKPQK